MLKQIVTNPHQQVQKLCYLDQIDKLPLIIDDKLGRIVLPNIKSCSSSYVQPISKKEIKVCQICSELLGLPFDKVCINNDFFDLGGNSILAVRLVVKINNYYQVHLKISDIYAYKKISLLVNFIEKRR